MTLKIGHWGLCIGRHCVRPAFDYWHGKWGTHYWHLTGFGFSLFHNTLSAETVGERGAW